MNILLNRNRLTNTENSLVVAKEGGGGIGMDWEFEISRYKLIYIRWTNNKVLLYSTGNYIRYPVMNHNGKEYERKKIWKEYVHIYIHIYSIVIHLYTYMHIYIHAYIHMHVCIYTHVCVYLYVCVYKWITMLYSRKTDAEVETPVFWSPDANK